MNKNISVAKFLVPIGAFLLLLSLVIFLSGIFFQVTAINDSEMAGPIMAFSLLGGLVLFIVGFIDKHVTDKRNKKAGLSVVSLPSYWSKIGWISIVIFAVLFVLFAMAMSNMSD